jgi:hypothetical protein
LIANVLSVGYDLSGEGVSPMSKCVAGIFGGSGGGTGKGVWGWGFTYLWGYILYIAEQGITNNMSV